MSYKRYSIKLKNGDTYIISDEMIKDYRITDINRLVNTISRFEFFQVFNNLFVRVSEIVEVSYE